MYIFLAWKYQFKANNLIILQFDCDIMDCHLEIFEKMWKKYIYTIIIKA